MPDRVEAVWDRFWAVYVESGPKAARKAIEADAANGDPVARDVLEALDRGHPGTETAVWA